MTYVVHHDVHAGQLAPDLCENANMETVQHPGAKELHEGHIGVLSFELDHLFDLLHLKGNKGCVWIAFSMDQGQDSMGFLPLIMAG
jgi:hypothetical protein